MTRRVDVTGLGIMSPLGHNVEDTWEAIKAGKSGIGPITRFDASNHLVKIAAEVKNSGEFWMDEIKILARSFLSVPVKLDSILVKLERGEISVRSPEVVHQVNRLEGAIRLVAGAIVFAALLLGGIELSVAGYELPGNILFVGAGLSLLWMILAGRHKD